MSLAHKRVPVGDIHSVPPSSREVARILWDKGLDFVMEKQVVPDRKFRHDFYLPLHNVAIEVEGGVFSKSRHTSGYGFQNDCYKYALSQAVNGTMVFRTTSDYATIRRIMNLVVRFCQKDVRIGASNNQEEQ